MSTKQKGYQPWR